MTGEEAQHEASYRKRFGDLATAKEYVTLAKLKEAIRLQVKEENELEKHRPIGELLVELGFMDLSQVNEIIEELLLLPSE